LPNNNETLEQLAQRLKLMDDIEERRKAINKLSKEQLADFIKIREVQGEMAGQAKEILNQKRNEITALQEERAALEKILELDGHRYAKHQARQILRENAAAYRREEIIDLERQLVLTEDMAEIDREAMAQKLRNLKLVEGRGKILSKIPAIGGLLGSIRTDPRAALGLAGVGIFIKFGRAMYKVAMDLHNTEAAFMKATGASKDFAKSIENTYRETRKYGATAADAAAATQALYTGFTDFTFASTQQRESLAETGVVLGRMGISHEDFAKSIQISTKALGMSAEAASQEMLNMQKFAENLGVSHVDLANQFAGAGNMMAKMGDQGYEAFKDLAIASKISGMEMQKILTLTDKFDTFEGAATMAGKLNAALGGNFVNAMEMMMATEPAERFGMIKDSLASAGLEFDTMSYYQKKFFAESMGLSDVSELSLIMSGNMDLVSGSVKQSSQDIEDAAKRGQAMASFQEKLNGLFAAMIPIITPVIDAFASFIGWITESEHGIEILLGVLGGLAIGFTALLLPISGTAAAITGIVAGIGTLAAAFFSDDVGASTFLDGLGKTAHAFKDIGGAMEALPTKKGIELTTSMKAMNGAMTGNTLAKVRAPGPTGGPTGASANLPKATVTETIRQPVEVKVGRDTFVKLMVEAAGEISSLSIKPYA